VLDGDADADDGARSRMNSTTALVKDAAEDNYTYGSPEPDEVPHSKQHVPVPVLPKRDRTPQKQTPARERPMSASAVDRRAKKLEGLHPSVAGPCTFKPRTDFGTNKHVRSRVGSSKYGAFVGCIASRHSLPLATTLASIGRWH
jgi:hypothetical protein